SVRQLDASGLSQLGLVHIEVEVRPEGVSVADLVASLVALGVPEQALVARVLEVLRVPDLPDEPRFVVPSLTHWTVDDDFPWLREAVLPERVAGRLGTLTYSLQLEGVTGGDTDEGTLWGRLFGGYA